MDRIEEQLQRLIDEQDTATFNQCIWAPMSEAKRRKALIKRNALRSEIADDWRAMLAALEAIEWAQGLPHGEYCPSCGMGRKGGEHMPDCRVGNAIAKARGVA